MRHSFDSSIDIEFLSFNCSQKNNIQLDILKRQNIYLEETDPGHTNRKTKSSVIIAYT